MFSVPRDTYTSVNHINPDTGKIIKSENTKINAAFAYGGGPDSYSFANTKLCIENLLEKECRPKDAKSSLNIPINFYAGINIDGIAAVSSAVGGVEVTLDYDLPNVGKKGETVTLKGASADEYIRNRHDTAGADLGRVVRQRNFMIKLAKKVKEMGAADMVITLYNELIQYGWTNLSTDQMLAFAKVLNSMDIDSIVQQTIPGDTATKSGTSYFIPDKSATYKLLLSIYYNKVS